MSQEATTGLATSLIGTVLSGRYRLESKLGSGGMSTVYLARDETLQRWVAVKVMHREMSDQPDQLERFRREARAVAQLSHPNVVAVIDAGEDGGHPYIVFEYVEGETLKQRIDRLGRLPVVEAAAYGIEVGRGLAAAHAHRLIHRDVKPQNVLIDPEGRAKVTDFGIARSLESDGLTKTGRVLGTTDYVAPEQAMGQAVDARCDVYSLGVLLYEMLDRRGPVPGGHAGRRGDEARQRGDAGRAGALPGDLLGARRGDRARDGEGARRSGIRTWSPCWRTSRGRSRSRSPGAGRPTGEATNVLDAIPARRRLLTPRRASAAGVVLVLAAVAAALLIAALTGERRAVAERGCAAGRGDRARRGPRLRSPAGRRRGARLRGRAWRSMPTRTRPGPPRPTRCRRSSRTPSPARQGVGLIVDAGQAGDRQEPDDPLGRGRLEPARSTAPPPARRRRSQGWGSPIGEAADHGHRADGRAHRDRHLALLPDLDHQGRLRRTAATTWRSATCSYPPDRRLRTRSRAAVSYRSTPSRTSRSQSSG